MAFAFFHDFFVKLSGTFLRLSPEATALKRNLEIIDQIVKASSDRFESFLHTYRKARDNLEELLRQPYDGNEALLRKFFVQLHTIKGNARIFGLSYIANTVHRCEGICAAMIQEEIPRDIQQLRALVAEIVAVVEEYQDVYTQQLQGFIGENLKKQAEIFETILDKYYSLDLTKPEDKTEFVATVLELTHRFDKISVRSIVREIEHGLVATARELGKEKPHIVIEDEGVKVDKELVPIFRIVFIHCLHNSLDHGIESPQIRRHKHKPEGGKINIRAFLSGGRLSLEIKDDGAGLNLARLKAKGLERNLIREDASRHDIANLIFASGVSTAETTTQISGRGMGLDAVKTGVLEAGGNIFLELLSPKDEDPFCQFQIIITLPSRFTS